uniref:HIG1 domain-containing protein n=1 Tax=Prasinoderma coloniale TaxID=156133 RepID=A0A7R9Y0T6_9VIRI
MVFLRSVKPYAGSEDFSIADVPREMTAYELARPAVFALGLGVPAGWLASGRNKAIRVPCVNMAMVLAATAGIFMSVDHAAKRLHGTRAPLEK